MYCLKCGFLLKEKKIDDRKRDVCPNCGWIFYKNPLPTAAAVFKENGTVLLAKRGVLPKKNRWSLPSGFIEIDETSEEACLRELKEETGLDARIKRLIGIETQYSVMYENVIVIAYEVEKTGGKLRAGTDVCEVKFFPFEGLPEIPFSSHFNLLKKSLEENKNS